MNALRVRRAGPQPAVPDPGDPGDPAELLPKVAQGDPVAARGRRFRVTSAAAAVITAAVAAGLVYHAADANRVSRSSLQREQPAQQTPGHTSPGRAGALSSPRPAPASRAAAGLSAHPGAGGAPAVAPAGPVHADGEVDAVSGGDEGPLQGGGALTISGQGLSSTGGVAFGDVPASFRVIDTTTVAVTVPAASHAGEVGIIVSDTSGRPMTTPNGVPRYTYLPLPGVTGVSPSSGVAGGGNWVSIYGSGFIDVSAVRFGSVDSTQTRPVNQTELQALVPAGSAGTVDVVVVTAGGTSPTNSRDRYTYL